ncbi:MAG TPA: thiol reductant ABC exporter subunit CydC [Acidimicrobiales bacterium]|nr:thiol reductant ABC exporter subunit CydC [Acidimicrobiales bacterium]
MSLSPEMELSSEMELSPEVEVEEEAPAPLGRTLGLVKPVRRRLVAVVILGSGAAAAAVGLLATSAWLISRASERPEESALALAIVGVQFFALSRGFLRYFERLRGHDAALRLLRDVRVEIYEKLERLAPSGIPEFQRGDLLARLVDDVDSVQDLLLRVLPPFAVAAVVGVIVVVLVWLVLPAAGLVLLVCVGLAAVIVPLVTGVSARRSRLRQAGARGELGATVVDLVEGADELVANGATSSQIARAVDADTELARAASASARRSGAGLGLTTLLMGVAVWGSLVSGIVAISRGHFDPVLLAVIALTPLAAFEAFLPLQGATQDLERVRRTSKRLFEIFDAPEPVSDPEDPLPPRSGPACIEIDRLCVRYGGRRTWALQGVDLSVPAGKRVGIVGPSGAGKSTLAGVTLRFVAYDTGHVSLSGVEVCDIGGDELRKVVGYVAHDTHVFDTTLEQNLRIAKADARPEELDDALSAVRLLDWVRGLPDGLQTRVGERGSRLSGGERQRLALARAVLSGFEILVLDEPTEHLDIPTADSIMQDVLSMPRPWSVVVITHRVSHLESMDEILFLDAGRVVERGTHVQLLEADGRYAEMWRREH